MGTYPALFEALTVQPDWVVSCNLGLTYDGEPVPPNCDGALGPPSSDPGEFATLGLGGSVALEFENPVAGLVQVWDVILGNEPPESAVVIGRDEDGGSIFEVATVSTKSAPHDALLFNASDGLIEVSIDTPIKTVEVVDTSPAKKRADGFDLTSVCVEFIRILISVNPGVDPDKPLNPKSEGLTPVAILGTSTFDVRDISPETVMFVPEGAPGSYAVRWDYKYSDSDDYEDLVLFFVTCEAFGQCGDSTEPSDVAVVPQGRPSVPTTIYITGETTDGEQVKGKGSAGT